MQGLKTKKVAKYMLLPEVVPRAKSLFASGFGYLAFLMATIYSSVRLLPNGHPYLDPKNIGKFGLRHVIAAAANNLVFKKKNLDQIIVFTTLLAGLVVLVLQFVLLIYAYIVQPAFAQSIFATPQPANDIAFLLLDQVFGIPGYSCNSALAAPGNCSNSSPVVGGRLPFHIALHGMFQFYSTGILLIGVFIFLYFVVVVVLETATTGTPFGQRFQNVFVPMRLVVALGLLVPVNYGLSSGQYITLFAAKWGSGFATNAWLTFNRTLKTGAAGANEFTIDNANPTGESESLLARPSPPNITPVVEFLSLAHACAYSHWRMEAHWRWEKSGGTWSKRADDYTRSPAWLNNFESTMPPRVNSVIKPYFVKNVRPWHTNTDAFEEVKIATTYADGLSFFDNGDIIIRFGRRAEDTPVPNDDDNFKIYSGGVEPTCGEMRITIGDVAHINQADTIGGADMIQRFHFDLIKQVWFNINVAHSGVSSSIELSDGTTVPLPSVTNHLITLAHRYAEGSLGTEPSLRCNIGRGGSNPNLNLPQLPKCRTEQPGAEAKQGLINVFTPLFTNNVDVAWKRFNENAQDAKMTQDILDRGWGGAGIWYNKIAEINGVFVSTVMNIPAPTKYPIVMEKVAKEKRLNDSDVRGLDIFEPNLAKGIAIRSMRANDVQIARTLADFFSYWNETGADHTKQENILEANAFKNIMNMIFGTNGLYDIRGQNGAQTHPLSQLSAVGKGLVESTIRNVAISSASAALGGVLGGGKSFIGITGKLFGDFLISTAFVGLTAGFVLFYVLPFLPFVYFYFAVGSWVKGIFEAMVGVPLWALAHLRLDGEGLPGESAANGYFLILEIFLRPILTVFALVASLLIFTAQVRLLNFLWGLVTGNITGAEVNPIVDSQLFSYSVDRGPVDEFFYTIIYTIVVYMLATGSFKLIDRIPDNILRWLGAGVSSFSDINQDPVEGLTKYAALGGLTVGQKTARGVYDLSGGVGAAGGRGLTSLQQLAGGTGGKGLGK